MKWQLLFKSAYITAVEFDGRKPTFTITGVKIVPLEDEKTGKDKDKGVVFFKEMDRGWVLCKTNAICLATMFGDDTTQWEGRRVTLFATEVQVGKEKKPGIRVLGSPDIAAPKQVEIKLPKKKKFFMTMAKTVPGQRAAPAQPAAPKLAPPPPSEPPFDGPPDDLLLPGQDGYEPPPPSDADAPSAA